MSNSFVQMDQFTHYVMFYKRLFSLTNWTTVNFSRRSQIDLLHNEEQAADLLVVMFSGRMIILDYR
jgi:hypothetical protein